VTTTASDKTLERIRRLLAYAEHPNTGPEEAETFRERAYALMAKYGVQRAHLAASGQEPDELGTYALIIDKTHQEERVQLLNTIAVFKTCRVMQWQLGGKSYVMICGHQSDLEVVKMLYASLSLQLAKEVANVTPSHGRSLATARKSFIKGFRIRVGQKMDAANQAARAETAHVEGRSTDLVVRDRKAAVNDYFDSLTPNASYLKEREGTVDNAAYRAGVAAGDRADIGGPRIGGQRAINA